MIEIPITDAPDQEMSVILNNRRVSLRLRYSDFSKRWSLDLSLDDAPVLYGRRIVTGRELLEGFVDGIGLMIALPAEDGADTEPTRQALPEGTVRLYHVSDADLPV